MNVCTQRVFRVMHTDSYYCIILNTMAYQVFEFASEMSKVLEI